MEWQAGEGAWEGCGRPGRPSGGNVGSGGNDFHVRGRHSGGRSQSVDQRADGVGAQSAARRRTRGRQHRLASRGSRAGAVGKGDPLRGAALYGFARRCISGGGSRSEEHTSELQSLMRISYAVFCLKKKKIKKQISN